MSVESLVPDSLSKTNLLSVWYFKFLAAALCLCRNELETWWNKTTSWIWHNSRWSNGKFITLICCNISDITRILSNWSGPFEICKHKYVWMLFIYLQIVGRKQYFSYDYNMMNDELTLSNIKVCILCWTSVLIVYHYFCFFFENPGRLFTITVITIIRYLAVLRREFLGRWQAFEPVGVGFS